MAETTDEPGFRGRGRPGHAWCQAPRIALPTEAAANTAVDEGARTGCRRGQPGHGWCQAPGSALPTEAAARRAVDERSQALVPGTFVYASRCRWRARPARTASMSSS